MFSNLTCTVREFLGIPQMQERIVDALSKVAERCALLVSHDADMRPSLATVTILCDTPGKDGKITKRTFGGEVFLSPGQKHTLRIPYTQHLVANCTYFVSGHPNIVITNFLVGQDSMFASDCGVKYGECDFVGYIGLLISVRLEYRVEGRSL